MVGKTAIKTIKTSWTFFKHRIKASVCCCCWILNGGGKRGNRNRASEREACCRLGAGEDRRDYKLGRGIDFRRPSRPADYRSQETGSKRPTPEGLTHSPLTPIPTHNHCHHTFGHTHTPRARELKAPRYVVSPIWLPTRGASSLSFQSDSFIVRVMMGLVALIGMTKSSFVIIITLSNILSNFDFTTILSVF